MKVPVLTADALEKVLVEEFEIYLTKETAEEVASKLSAKIIMVEEVERMMWTDTASGVYTSASDRDMAFERISTKCRLFGFNEPLPENVVKVKKLL